MTQEEKQLLLQDLSARLPYYPKCEMIDEIRVVNNEKDSSYISTLFPKHIELFSYHNNFTIKPYLRPLSSMTEEEKKIIRSCGFGLILYDTGYTGFTNMENYIDEVSFRFMEEFLNAHHFDYRDLIEKGLAIEAPNDMYEI